VIIETLLLPGGDKAAELGSIPYSQEKKMNKFLMRKITQAVALATLTGTGITAAQAGDTVINSGDIAATISDAGYFSSSTELGLSFRGNEFVNAGTFQSWYWLNAPGVSGTPFVAEENTNSNPLDASASSTGMGTAIVSGGTSGLNFSQTISIPSANQLAVAVTLTNNTGHALDHVQWGVGIDPDQDSLTHGDPSTINTIAGLGNDAAVSATGLFSGYTVTLENTTPDSGFNAAAFINSGNCCDAVNPADALAANQGVGFNTVSDSSISLAYDLGTIAAGETASFSYAYNMSVVPVTPPIPEPETYAMLLAGLGVIGFMARRRRAA
jgi:hypothetical protein